LFVERPCLSVFGGIQPDLLPDLRTAADKEDGFLDRVLLGWPDPLRDHWTDDVIDPGQAKLVQDVFNALFAMQPDVDVDGEPHPRQITLSPEAKAAWVAWYEAHAAEMADERFPKYLRGPWAKMPGQLARVALILHCVRVAAGEALPDQIDVTTFAMAM